MNYFKIIIAVLSLSLFSCQGPKSDKVELLDAKTFSEKIQNAKDIQIVDVRTPEEFEEQHINDARNINWNGLDFEEQAATLDKSKPVYVYCKSGGRSAKASAKLAEMGYTQIYELDGGMMKWNAAGLSKPSTTETIGMTEDDFNKLLVSDKKILIDFYAEWCAPCKKMSPFLDKMTTEMADDVTIVRIDADKNKTLADLMKIEALPTLIIYKNREVKWKHEGFISELDLKKEL